VQAYIKYCKALSDETRIRLMQVLGQHELSVNELVTLIEMGQSGVSRHLKILASAGLITARRDGLWVFYTSAQEGQSHQMWQALRPFIQESKQSRDDHSMATRIIEERALRTRQFFNSIADHWDTLSRDILGSFDLPAAIIKAMPKPCQTAVDLGCGTGAVLEAMRKHCSTVIGVDGSPRMLELARRRFEEDAKGVSLRIGELDHLPLGDAEANFACINMVLHHLATPKTALHEISRSLHAKGQLIIVDFEAHAMESMRTEYGDAWLGFEAPLLHTWLEQAGFTNITSSHHPVEQNLVVHVTIAQKL